MNGQINEQDTTSVAVIGLSARFPEANSVREFWRNIAAGKESIITVSPEEAGLAGIAPNGAGRTFVNRVSIIDRPEHFDSAFFAMTSRETTITAPSHRLLLMCSHEALEDAGYAVPDDSLRVGVFVGANKCDNWQKRLYGLGSEAKDGLARQLQLLVANDADYCATRISYKLNLTGPSVSVNTACSTSLVAIHLACKSLLAYESDIALAGGGNIVTGQSSGYFHEPGGMQSGDGRCRAFDARSDGTVFGNGVGIVVLKRLEDALSDGDSIYAVVRGSSVNNDGSGKVGYTAPSVTGQARVISDAMAFAEVAPDDIGYIEAHGTGTALGDPIEVEALTQAFGCRNGNASTACALGSVKTNVGHLGTAAGVAGFIKTVMALHHHQLPPSLHFERPNPRIDLESGPFYVNTRLEDWPTVSGKPRRAGVSSFGVGGTNAHVVLEEAPPVVRHSGESEPQAVLLSARSESALNQMRTDLAAYLRDHPELNPADVAFTLQAGRETFDWRMAVTASTCEELASQLDDSRRKVAQPMKQRPRLAFMFPGQGAQYPGMGRGLYESEPIFASAFDHCAELLLPHLGADLRERLYGKNTSENGDFDLQETAFAQPALFAVEYACARLLGSLGVEPDCMIGHSLGEYVAACLAGVLSLDSALALVAARGRIMQSMPPGRMAAVAVDERRLADLLDAQCELAAVNSEAWCVVSGTDEGIRHLETRCRESGIDFRPLNTSHGFHSWMMEPAASGFEREISRFALGAPRVPYISNVTGTWIVQEEASNPAYWAQHLRQPVRFLDGVRTLLQMPDTLLLEVGPGDTLTQLVSATAKERAPVLNIGRPPKSKRGDRMYWLNALAKLWTLGARVDWRKLHGASDRRRISLPTYPFECTRYSLEHGDSPPVETDARGQRTRVGSRFGTLSILPRSNEVRLHAWYDPDDLDWIGDHRRDRTVVVPEGHMLAQVFYTLNQVYGADAGAWTLAEVVFHSPLEIGGQAPVQSQVILSPRTGMQEGDFEIVAAPASEGAPALTDERWITVASGLFTVQGDRQRTPPLDVLKRTGLDSELGDAAGAEAEAGIYHELAVHGYQLVDRARLIDGHWRSDDGELYRLSFAASGNRRQAEDASRSFDCMLKSCVAAAGKVMPEAVTVGVARIAALTCFESDVAHWCFQSHGDTDASWDALLLDAAGNPVASVRGVEMLMGAAQSTTPGIEPGIADGPSPAYANFAPDDPDENRLADLLGERLSFLLGESSIDRDTPFIEMGMSSLMAIEYAMAIGNELATDRVAEDISVLNLLAEGTTVNSLAEQLCRTLASGRGTQDVEDQPVEAEDDIATSHRIIADPVAADQPFPLTDIQQAYWIGRDSGLSGGGVATYGYIETDVHELDIPRLEDALNGLIERHPMLRVVILPDGRQQCLASVPRYRLRSLDLSQVDPSTRERELAGIRRQMAQQVLATDRWPLFELRVSRIDADCYRLHVGIDFLVADVLSLRIFLKDLFLFYIGKMSLLESFEISFRDYVLAEQERRRSETYQRSRQYWLDRLDDLPPAPALPTVAEAGHGARPQFKRLEGRLEISLWEKLKTQARRQHVTPSVLLSSVFATVLSRWSGERRFTLNLTVFNRPTSHPDFSRLIGDFTSSILLAIDLTDASDVLGRAKTIQRQLLQDLAHAAFSGIEVLRAIHSRRGSQPAVLMPVVLTSALGLDQFQGDLAEGLSVDELRLFDELRHLNYSVAQTPQVWLDHVAIEFDGALLITWDYAANLFPPGLIEDMFGAYMALLEVTADESAAYTSTHAGLPALQLERRQLLNRTEEALPDLLLQQLFAESVARSPHAIAIRQGGWSMSYLELHTMALEIAAQLVERGTQPNELVGVVMEKGWEQIAAVLGILYAGAAYLPIDANLPDERKRQLLHLGEVAVVITQTRFSEQIDFPHVVTVEPVRIAVADAPASFPTWRQGTSDLAYVIFTSGSTGTPKGVAVDHRAVVNTVLDINRRFDVTETDSILAVSSLSFDLSVYDIFGLLAAGGTVVVPPAEVSKDPKQWLQDARTENVTLWNSVPALAQLLVEQLELEAPRGRGADQIGLGLRLVMMSGDWIPLNLPERLRTQIPEASLISLGGATEAAIWSIFYPIGDVDTRWKSIPYGRPLTNQQIHVLDQDMSPAPDWVAGEIYIGGMGLAQGYWRDEETTSSAFVRCPHTGDRLYRTGDMGRVVPEGYIEFLGRNDHQVKVRGHRVELGEIEAVIISHRQVESAVVLAVTDGGRTRLAGFAAAPSLREDGASFGVDFAKLAIDDDSKLLVEGTDVAAFKLGRSSLRTLMAEAGSLDLTAMCPDAGLLSWSGVRANASDDSSQLESSGPLPQRAFAAWLLAMGETAVEGNPLPKYWYASAGSLNAVQVYLGVGRNAVEDVAEGFYYVNPASRRLHRTSVGDVSGYAVEQGIIDLFLVEYKPAIEPIYGRFSARLCTLEAGHIGYLMQEVGIACGLQLTGSQSMSGDDLRRELALDERYRLIRTLSFSRAAKPSHLPILASCDLLARQSYRQFDGPKVELAKLQSLLVQTVSRLREIIGESAALLQVYLYVKPGGVADLHDCYTVSLEDGQLTPYSTNGVIGGELHGGGNRQVFEYASFSIFLLGAEEAQSEEQLYVAGAFGQVLLMLAPASTIGLCPIGGLDFDKLLQYLRADSGQSVLYCFEGGGVSEEQMSQWPAKTVKGPRELARECLALCRQRLPDYMVPAQFRVLGELPLTGNGKVDRKVLLDLAAKSADEVAGKQHVAPRNALEKSLHDIWCEQLGLEKIDVFDDFFELGGNSLEAVRVVTTVRAVTGVELPLRLFFDAPTIAGLATILLPATADELSKGSQEKTVAEADAANPALASNDVLVPLQTDATGNPYFLVHPVGGQIVCYLTLSQRLARPVYGLQAEYGGGVGEGSQTLEQMARRYIDAIRTIQPNGPYVVGGWSIGATIAYEMARQLVDEGEQIDRIVVIDGPPPVMNGEVDDKRLLTWFLEDTAGDLPQELFYGLEVETMTEKEQLTAVAQRASSNQYGELDIDRLLPLFRTFKKMLHLASAYDPPVLEVPMQVIRATDNIVAEFVDHPFSERADWGWGLLSNGEITAEEVAGTHYSLLSESVDAVAMAMDRHNVNVGGETEALV